MPNEKQNERVTCGFNVVFMEKIFSTKKPPLTNPQSLNWTKLQR